MQGANVKVGTTTRYGHSLVEAIVCFRSTHLISHKTLSDYGFGTFGMQAFSLFLKTSNPSPFSS